MLEDLDRHRPPSKLAGPNGSRRADARTRSTPVASASIAADRSSPTTVAPRSIKLLRKPALAATQVEDAAAGERRRDCSTIARSRGIVRPRPRLEPPVERVEPDGDDRFMLGDHEALPARVSSRCFQARTATETPERAQNMKPSTPSRNPCLKT